MADAQKSEVRGMMLLVVSEKRCSKCGETKPVGDGFYFDKSKGAPASACRECHKALMRPRSRRHFEQNREDYYRRKRQRRRDLAAWVHVYKKDHPTCLDCKQDHPPWRLDFDHVRGVKESCISRVPLLGWGIERVEKEIAKCEIVCANCHRDRTEQRRARACVDGSQG